MRVLWGQSEIGSIDAQFAQQAKLEELSFVLGARAWHAVAIDWNDGFVRVEPMAASEGVEEHRVHHGVRIQGDVRDEVEEELGDTLPGGHRLEGVEHLSSARFDGRQENAGTGFVGPVRGLGDGGLHRRMLRRAPGGGNFRLD